MKLKALKGRRLKPFPKVWEPLSLESPKVHPLGTFKRKIKFVDLREYTDLLKGFTMKDKNVMKKLIQTVTLFALIFSASSALPATSSFQTPVARISQLLPSETVNFVYLRNLKGPWQQFKRSELFTQLGQLKVIQEVWESSEAAPLFQGLEQFREFTGIKLTEENLLSLAGEEICLALVSSPSPSESGAPPQQGLLILKVSPLVTLMTKMTGSLMALTGSKAITSEEFEGITLYHLQGFSFGIIENYAFLSDNRETLRQEIRLVLGRRAGTLDEDPEFREISGEMEGDYHGFVYHKIAAHQTARTLSGRLRNLLLDDIQAVTFRITFTGDPASPLRLAWKALYTQEGREKGLGKFREVSGGSLKSLDLIPADTVFYLASPRFSMQLYYSYFLRTWFNNPEELVTHGRFLHKMETALGLDSKERSVPSPGNELAVAGTGIGFNGEALYLKLIGLFQVDPREAALNLGEKLFRYIFGEPLSTLQKGDVEVHYAGAYQVNQESEQDENLEEPANPQAGEEEVTIQDGQVNSEAGGRDTTPGGRDEGPEQGEAQNGEEPGQGVVTSINPSYGYLSGYLVVARDLDTFESVIKTEGRLSDNKNLQALLARKSDAHWVFFLNTEKLMDALSSYITDLAGVKSNYVYQDAKDRLIPLTEVLKAWGDIQGWLTFGEEMVEGELEMIE